MLPPGVAVMVFPLQFKPSSSRLSLYWVPHKSPNICWKRVPHSQWQHHVAPRGGWPSSPSQRARRVSQALVGLWCVPAWGQGEEQPRGRYREKWSLELGPQGYAGLRLLKEEGEDKGMKGVSHWGTAARSAGRNAGLTARWLVTGPEGGQ